MLEDIFMVMGLIIWTLQALIAVFLSSWFPLFLFTRDGRKSATVSALAAVITTGLWLATGFVLHHWRPFIGWLALTLYTTEVLVVSMGICYLRLSNKREAVVSGLIIFFASIAAVFFFPWLALLVGVLKNSFFSFLL